MSVRLVGVFAHPDDDTHGIGGLLALAPEIPATLVIATSGEAGTIVDDAAATRETLAEVREREELAALAALGRPDVVITFGPDGITRHPDHVAAGQAASEAFRRARVAGAGDDGLTFRRLYHHGIPRSRIERVFHAEAFAQETLVQAWPPPATPVGRPAPSPFAGLEG